MSTRFTYNKGTDDGLAALRASVPEVEVVDKRAKSGAWWLDVLLVWVLLFGVWPFGDPGHGGESLSSVVDIVLHCLAVAWLTVRWKLARR